LAQEGLRSHIVNVVHDEVLVDASEEEIPMLVEHIPRLMDAPYPWNGEMRLSEVVPIETDLQVSYTSWAEKQPFVLENETV
jgi:DNA polymerase I-like protein with 3'-5' exonuclease and polymerase domains